MITGADVVVSCVTVAHGQFASDTCFKSGVLVVPVHTRGFQNCDLFFDQIFADDVAHVEGFKYFNQFKQFDEFARILLKQNPGRTSDQERILAYNIGIALHDIYFASQVYDKVKDSLPDISSDKLSEVIVLSAKLISICTGDLRPLVTNSPYFYVSLTAMILGTQMFLAGFIGELISRDSPNRNKYKIETEL